eukprot:4756735-Prorocentrum_lima.AAC.1
MGFCKAHHHAMLIVMISELHTMLLKSICQRLRRGRRRKTVITTMRLIQRTVRGSQCRCVAFRLLLAP